MNAVEKEVNELVFKELNNANEKFPLFSSPHHGYAVIKEEIEEIDYEKAKLEGESIDEIFADVEDLPDDKNN